MDRAPKPTGKSLSNQSLTLLGLPLFTKTIEETKSKEQEDVAHVDTPTLTSVDVQSEAAPQPHPHPPVSDPLVVTDLTVATESEVDPPKSPEPDWTPIPHPAASPSQIYMLPLLNSPIVGALGSSSMIGSPSGRDRARSTTSIQVERSLQLTPQALSVSDATTIDVDKGKVAKVGVSDGSDSDDSESDDAVLILPNQVSSSNATLRSPSRSASSSSFGSPKFDGGMKEFRLPLPSVSQQKRSPPRVPVAVAAPTPDSTAIMALARNALRATVRRDSSTSSAVQRTPVNNRASSMSLFSSSPPMRSMSVDEDPPSVFTDTAHFRANSTPTQPLMPFNRANSATAGTATGTSPSLSPSAAPSVVWVSNRGHNPSAAPGTKRAVSYGFGSSSTRR